MLGPGPEGPLDWFGDNSGFASLAMPTGFRPTGLDIPDGGPVTGRIGGFGPDEPPGANGPVGFGTFGLDGWGGFWPGWTMPLFAI